MEFLQIKRRSIEPEVSPINLEVVISLRFSLADLADQIPAPVPIRWVVTYLIDSAGRRQSLALLETASAEYLP